MNEIPSDMIDENSGAIIELNEGKEFAQQYNKLFPTEIPAYFVGKRKLQNILEQENCIGLKIYNGYDGILKKKNIIIVGVDNVGKEIHEIIVERTLPCPPAATSNDLLL